MNNNFFTPEEIDSREKYPCYKREFSESYDFALLQQDVFQIVSPHIESISDRKHKIISWLKKIPLLQRINILTYTNKQFVCIIRAMYEKKSKFHCFHYFPYRSNVPFINKPSDQFDLLPMVNTKKLSEEYLVAQDQLLNSIQIMSRYTQFDSITFNQVSIRNVQKIFHYFQILGYGIAYELTIQHYQRLRSQPNSLMFYDPSQQHCYKKAPLGTWITEVFMKHISMKYFEYQISPPLESYNDLKQRSKQFQKYWKIISAQRKNAIIKKVLLMKPIDLYQQHRSMIKVTRNAFPLIQKSEKAASMVKSILNSSEKQIFQLLLYTSINQTLESHSVLKFYFTLEIQDEIKSYNALQKDIAKINKMKKKKKQKNFQPTNKFKNQSEQNKFIANTQNVVCIDNNMTLQKQLPKNKEIKQIMEGQKIIVKGTDLFYKKLEVSSTQHIVSFECNLDIPSQNKSQQTSNMVPQQEAKTKTNNKKKKKNKSKLKEQSKTLVLIQQPANNINENAILLIKKNHKLPQKQILVKSSNKIFDQSSEKSSETTNDQAQGSKDQNHQYDIKIEQKELQKKKSDPLDLIFKDLQKRISFYNKQRRIVINRLMYVFAQHKLSFKVYGSSSCDAALPTSDIDIVVDPSIVDYFFFTYANYKKKIINSLEYLQKAFQKFEWTANFILLSGAKIPLLTFTVNPGIQFDLEHGNHLYNNRKELKQPVKISVDITIEPYVNMIDQVPMHLGVESSELIKQWISMFPFYLQLLILLKIFTKNQDLNKTYHGGISSFMQAVMLADFYKNISLNFNIPMNQLYTKKQRLAEVIPTSWNLSKFFLLYCKFIVQFDEEKEMLDVNSEGKKSFKEFSIAKDQFCIINPLTGKIMSERCILFPLYKKLITELYEKMNQKNQAELNQHLRIVFEA